MLNFYFIWKILRISNITLHHFSASATSLRSCSLLFSSSFIQSKFKIVTNFFNQFNLIYFHQPQASYGSYSAPSYGGYRAAETDMRAAYAPASGYAAPAYSAQPSYGPVHAGPSTSYSYPSSSPKVPCPTNLLFSCAPQVAPVPCSSVSYASAPSSYRYGWELKINCRISNKLFSHFQRSLEASLQPTCLSLCSGSSELLTGASSKLFTSSSTKLLTSAVEL